MYMRKDVVMAAHFLSGAVYYFGNVLGIAGPRTHEGKARGSSRPAACADSADDMKYDQHAGKRLRSEPDALAIEMLYFICYYYSLP